jgi:hypothetical protein
MQVNLTHRESSRTHSLTRMGLALKYREASTGFVSEVRDVLRRSESRQQLRLYGKVLESGESSGASGR